MARPLSFGLLLKRYRRAAAVTQAELARNAGYSEAYISKLEQGARTPTAATVELLAHALALNSSERSMLEAARRALPSAIFGEGTATSRDAVAVRPLTGRLEELALIDRHLAGLEPPVLLFTGEPGIGKTRLLQEARSRAGGFGITVLEGGCYRSAGPEPFAPILAALERHIRRQSPDATRIALNGCEWLARLLPELTALGIEPFPKGLVAGQERRLMFRAVAQFLSNVAGAGGTLLILDDLQWTGSDAVELLATLARSAAETGLRIAGASRHTEVSPRHPLAIGMADLLREDLVTDVRLGPVSMEEAAELLSTLVGRGDLPDREGVLQRSGGVPLFLVSFASAIQSGAGRGTPHNLVHGIRQRVAAIPDRAQDLLQIAAVAGRRVLRRALYMVARLPESEVLGALDVLLASGLLVEDGDDGYRFSHDLIRDVAEADMGAARRTALHGRIATALEDLFPEVQAAVGIEQERVSRVPATGGEVEEVLTSSLTLRVELLAYHFAHSDVPERSIAYLRRAAESAESRFALTAAEGHYRELVERLDALGRDQASAEVRERLGRFLTVAARYQEALEVLEQAANIFAAAGDLEGRMKVTAQIGLVHARRRTPQDGIALLRPMLALGESMASPSGTAALYIVLSDLFFTAHHYGEGLVAAERAVELAQQDGDEQALRSAEIHRATALILLGEHDRGLRVLEAAMPNIESVGDLTSLFNAFRSAGFMATETEYLDRALAIAKKLGDPVQIIFILSLWRQNAFMLGDWKRSRRYADQAAALARQMGDTPMSGQCLMGLGVLRVLTGESEQGQHDLDEAAAILEREHNVYALLITNWIQAERDLVTGRPEEARRRLEQTFERYGLEESATMFPPVLVGLALAYRALGKETSARELAEIAHSRAIASDDRPSLCDTLWLKGTLVDGQDRSEENRLLRDSLSLARSMPFPYGEARAHYWYGVMYLQRGERQMARERLQDALAIFRRLGGHLHARAIEAQIRDLAH